MFNKKFLIILITFRTDFVCVVILKGGRNLILCHNTLRIRKDLLVAHLSTKNLVQDIQSIQAKVWRHD